jgi:hypothetical protein
LVFLVKEDVVRRVEVPMDDNRIPLKRKELVKISDCVPSRLVREPRRDLFFETAIGFLAPSVPAFR